MSTRKDLLIITFNFLVELTKVEGIKTTNHWNPRLADVWNVCARGDLCTQKTVYNQFIVSHISQSIFKQFRYFHNFTNHNEESSTALQSGALSKWIFMVYKTAAHWTNKYEILLVS